MTSAKIRKGMEIQSMLALGSMPVLFIHSISETPIIPEIFQIPVFALVITSISSLLIANTVNYRKSNKENLNCRYCDDGKVEISQYTCDTCGKKQ